MGNVYIVKSTGKLPPTYAEGFFPRSFHYKADATQCLNHLRAQLGEGTIEKVSAVRAAVVAASHDLGIPRKRNSKMSPIYGEAPAPRYMEAWICCDQNGKFLGAYTAESIATDSWRLSYCNHSRKAELVIGERTLDWSDRPTGVITVSLGEELIGTVHRVTVYDRVEYL